MSGLSYVKIVYQILQFGIYAIIFNIFKTIFTMYTVFHIICTTEAQVQRGRLSPRVYMTLHFRGEVEFGGNVRLDDEGGHLKQKIK